MSSPATALQKAIHAKLSNDADLMAVVKDVYDYIPSQDIHFPYISFEQGEYEASGDGCVDEVTISHNIAAWSIKRGVIEVKDIIWQIDKILDQLPDTDGWSFGIVKANSTSWQRDPETGISVGIIQINTSMEEIGET